MHACMHACMMTRVCERSHARMWTLGSAVQCTCVCGSECARALDMFHAPRTHTSWLEHEVVEVAVPNPEQVCDDAVPMCNNRVVWEGKGRMCVCVCVCVRDLFLILFFNHQVDYVMTSTYVL